MLRYCADLKAMRYESTSFNRIAAYKSHRVIAALELFIKNKMSTGQHNSPRPMEESSMTKKIVPQRLLVNTQSEKCDDNVYDS